MKIILFNLYVCLFFLLPIPLFFELQDFSLFLIRVDEFNYLLDSPKIPVPIGALALFFSIILGYCCSLVSPERMSCVMRPKALLVFYLFVVFPLFLYVRFVSGLAMTRIVQVMLPLLFLSMLSFPRKAEDRLAILSVSILGAAVFFGLHFLSILIESDRFISPDEKLEFSSFFGYLLYQSLVSYPGVLSLYLFLCFAVIYSRRVDGEKFSRTIKVLVWMLPVVLLYLLAASGRRAFLVEFLSGSAIVLFSCFIYMVSHGRIKIRASMYFSLFLALAVFFFVFYFLSPLSDRVVSSIYDNTFDSGRLNIISKAYAFFSDNVAVFFLGAGGHESPGFHNYILDQVYRVGLVGFLWIYFVNGFLIYKFVKMADLGVNMIFARKIFSIVLLSCLFWQSMINASISQPFYFVNFLLVAMLSVFVVFSVPNSSVIGENFPGGRDVEGKNVC
tara:strand:+ start:6104 stop:7438 length:1335 start_codon:yes stop_codon:yes gene_type:complete